MSGTSTGLTVNGTSVEIEDNEEPTIILDIEPFLHANPDKLPEDAGATRVTVTAGTKGGVFALDREVYVTVGKDDDSAVFGTDWDSPLRNFHVTIKANKTEGEETFTLTPTDDTLVEDDEVITLTGSATVDWLEVTEETITIEDNDVPAMTLAASPASVVENAGDNTVTVTVATGGVTFKADRTVSVTVGQSGDSATSGTDYKTVSGFDVMITKGQTSGKAEFTLTPIDDSLVEGNESITVAGTTTGYTVTSTSVTITDDEAVPEVNLSVNPASVGEGEAATAATVTATFSNTNTFAVDKTVTVAVGGSGTATSGTDYAAVSNFDITITKGTSSGTGTFTLTPIDDALVESTETIGIDGTSTGLTVTGTSMTLTDDDSAQVLVNDASADEGDAITFTVSLDNAVAGGLTVTPTFTDGTAVKGTDYTENTTALSFTGTAGETQTITVATTDDKEVEADETFTVSLTASHASVTATDTGTGTINNNDGVPRIDPSPATRRCNGDD